MNAFSNLKNIDEKTGTNLKLYKHSIIQISVVLTFTPEGLNRGRKA